MNLESTTSSTNSIKMPEIKDPDCLLSEHVRHAVEQYFSQINGHPASGLYAMFISEVEKPLIETVLKQVGFNQTKASKALGISRSTLHKKMNLYGLE